MLGRVLFGALGSDLVANEDIEILRKDGIVTELIQFTREASSGQAYINVDSYGRNSIMTFKEANDIFTDSVVETENVVSTIRSCSLVTVIDPPLAVARKLVFQSAAAQKITVWATGILSSFGAKKVIDIIRDINFLVLNSYE